MTSELQRLAHSCGLAGTETTSVLKAVLDDEAAFWSQEALADLDTVLRCLDEDVAERAGTKRRTADRTCGVANGVSPTDANQKER